MVLHFLMVETNQKKKNVSLHVKIIGKQIPTLIETFTWLSISLCLN